MVSGMIDSAADTRFTVLPQPGVCQTVVHVPLGDKLNAESQKNKGLVYLNRFI